jgi:hypothetical protein
LLPKIAFQPLGTQLDLACGGRIDANRHLGSGGVNGHKTRQDENKMGNSFHGSVSIV